MTIIVLPEAANEFEDATEYYGDPSAESAT